MAASRTRRRSEDERPNGGAERTRRGVANSAALLVIAALSWGAIQTPVFRAGDVRVVGATRLNPDHVLRAAGLGPRTNVLTMSVGDAERRLERDPWISDATVTRELPSSLTVEIRERRAVAAVRTRSGWATVAADGTVLAVGKRPPVLPEVIMAGRRGQTRPGDVISAAHRMVAVIASFPSRFTPVRAEADERGVVEVRLRSGVRVVVGGPERFADKMRAVQGLLDWARARGSMPVRIDVRVPSAPAMRLVSARV